MAYETKCSSCQETFICSDENGSQTCKKCQVNKSPKQLAAKEQLEKYGLTINDVMEYNAFMRGWEAAIDHAVESCKKYGIKYYQTNTEPGKVIENIMLVAAEIKELKK